MSVYPTRLGLELTVVALLVLGGGLVQLSAQVVSWGGAMLLGLAIARALTLLDVRRVRASGLEMAWTSSARQVQAERGRQIQVEAELRNRDGRAVRFECLRALAAPLLDVQVEPRAGQIDAGQSLTLKLTLASRRVGRHGLFGLSLDLSGGAGLFRVPLNFSNPYGLEVLPNSARWPRARRGRAGEGGPRTSRLRAGSSDEVRELREHQAGDSYRRIAWKPSARRGRLLVREHEAPEQELLWLLVVASAELCAGPVGAAPLDRALDGAAGFAEVELSRGNRVGLAVLCGAQTDWHEPGRGRGHQRRLLEALSASTSLLSPERSGLDERQVAQRVEAHLRTFWPNRVGSNNEEDSRGLVRRAREALPHAPFPQAAVAGGSASERVLRSYLAAFGMNGPPRLEPEEPASLVGLQDCLGRFAGGNRRQPTLVRIVAPLPADPASLASLRAGLGALRRRGARVEWWWVSEVGAPTQGGALSEQLLLRAGGLRQAATERRVRAELRRSGVRLRPCPQSAAPPDFDRAAGAEPAARQPNGGAAA